jgi:hypothetical protein
MSHKKSAILAAVGDLYESVLDEQKCLPAMQAIHRLVGADVELTKALLSAAMANALKTPPHP